SAYENADPVLLEPIMELEVSTPDEAVGAVNGDLNSRRGRLQGMEPRGGMTSIKAEVPMAEILTYSQALTSMTGGRGDYHMHFLRYEEGPPDLAQKGIDDAKKEKEEGKGRTWPLFPPRRLNAAGSLEQGPALRFQPGRPACGVDLAGALHIRKQPLRRRVAV